MNPYDPEPIAPVATAAVDLDPVEPPQAPRPARARGTWRRLLDDSGYALSGFVLAWVAFVVAVAGVSLGVSTLILVTGVPVLVFTLIACRGFAQVERVRLRRLGRPMAAGVYPRAAPEASWWQRQLTVLRDPQSWLDLVWALLVAPALATLAFCVVITWWAAVLGGATYWFWQRWIPASDGTLASLLGLGEGRGPEIVLNTAFGVLAVLTIVPVVRAVVGLQAAASQMLLGTRPALQAELTALHGQHDAAQQAEVDSLRRLERDLHDGPQQRLVRLSMDLGRARKLVASDPEKAQQVLDEALVQAQETVGDLRALSRGIAPPLLVDRGLTVALSELAARHPGHVQVQVDLPTGLSPAAETAIFFTVSEALTNVAKHARAEDVRIAVETRGDDLLVMVADDGIGGAHPGKGQGLVGLQQRVAGLGGRLEVDSPEGGPSVVCARLPLAACVS